MTSTETTSLELSGLDGSNPLAFLAALGAWRTAADIHTDTRLSWTKRGGTWTPLLVGSASSPKMLVNILQHRLKESSIEAFTLSKKMPFAAKLLRDSMITAVEHAQETGIRRQVDFLSALGSEVIKDADDFVDTAFRMVRAGDSAGQGLPAYAVAICEDSDVEALHRTLFAQWDYADGKPSLRWDPADDRRYALRWKEPSGDPIRTMRGANRLAIEALPLFPTAPVGNKLETTGFRTGGSRNTFFSWPIWETPISIDVGRSLLALPELQLDAPPRDKLRPMGIVDVLRSQRLTIGKFRNFAPSQSI